MTPQELDAIRQRCNAATPGPWVVPPAELYKNDTWHLWIATESPLPEHPHSQKFIAWMTGGLGYGRVPQKPDADTTADATFIAHARTDIPALLAEVDRLTAENEELYGTLNTPDFQVKRNLHFAEARVAALSEENARLRAMLGSWGGIVAYALQGRDHDDFFPWTFQPYVDDEGNLRDHGGISTPNGRRGDGSMHTYWSIAGDVWEPVGRLIVEAVNAAAAAALAGVA